VLWYRGSAGHTCLASCESPVWQAARVAGSKAVAQERGGPLPSMDVADALLDERRELTATTHRRYFHKSRCRHAGTISDAKTTTPYRSC
jgi:hypothetical protein